MDEVLKKNIAIGAMKLVTCPRTLRQAKKVVRAVKDGDEHKTENETRRLIRQTQQGGNDGE